MGQPEKKPISIIVEDSDSKDSISGDYGLAITMTYGEAETDAGEMVEGYAADALYSDDIPEDLLIYMMLETLRIAESLYPGFRDRHMTDMAETPLAVDGTDEEVIGSGE